MVLRSALCWRLQKLLLSAKLKGLIGQKMVYNPLLSALVPVAEVSP